MPGLGEMLFGSQPKTKQLEVLTPEQKNALKGYFNEGIGTNPLYQQGSSFLQNLLSNQPGAFSAFEEPHLQNFEQRIAPGIAERFAGMGTGAGALSSSGLQQSLAQAGRGLSTDLAGLRSGLQMQSLPQALGYAQQPYTNTLGGLGVQSFQNAQRPGSQGLLGGLAGGLGTAAGFALGGPIGASIGGSLGNGLGSMFGGGGGQQGSQLGPTGQNPGINFGNNFLGGFGGF